MLNIILLIVLSNIEHILGNECYDECIIEHQIYEDEDIAKCKSDCDGEEKKKTAVIFVFAGFMLGGICIGICIVVIGCCYHHKRDSRQHQPSQYEPTYTPVTYYSEQLPPITSNIITPQPHSVNNPYIINSNPTYY